MTAPLKDLARSLRAMPPSARKLVEEAIELLLLACDEMDGDPDLEDDGTAEPSEDAEPSLGWSDMEARYGVPFQGRGGPDLEDEHDGREPDADEEDGADAEQEGTT